MVMQKRIRNFSIIAHIDHGKSTLADRMLQITDTVSAREMRDQYLDKIDIERERGITIKLQPARMEYQDHILNLIDTPGHIDFGYEVSRALAACEGAILLVDASQGIEAQTLANVYKAQAADLTIIPVVNKIDLNTAHPEAVALDLHQTFGFSQDEIIFTSGKSGAGIEQLLQTVIDRIPSPQGTTNAPLRALIFDSYYDQHKGVVAYIRVVDGRIDPTDLYLMNTQTPFTPIELGFLGATQYSSPLINTGEVGYLATGLKDINQVRVGDTVTLMDNKTAQPLPGYQEPKPMVFANLFPEDAGQARELREAVEQYNLMDAAFSFEPIKSQILGSGFRCGFLGLLHVDIVQERIDREFNVPTQITTPNVRYQVTRNDSTTVPIQSPVEMPAPNHIQEITEPWCQVLLYTQQEYIGPLLKVSEDHRGIYKNMEYFGLDQTADAAITSRVRITYEMPLSEVISKYFDQIKSVSSGYASLDYKIIDQRPVDLVRLDVLLNQEAYPALARLVIRNDAPIIGKRIVNKLKDLLPRQQFKVPIQAVVGGKVVARADLPAMRKDVTAKLYGGDRTRKDKLLKKQAAGKKRLQESGKVNIPPQVYQKMISL